MYINMYINIYYMYNIHMYIHMYIDIWWYMYFPAGWFVENEVPECRAAAISLVGAEAVMARNTSSSSSKSVSV
jgi:hypothetical protein